MMLFRCLGLAAVLCLAGASMAQNAPKRPNTRTTPSPNVPPNVIPATEPVQPDYAPATWVPANPRNYQSADRPAQYDINMILIHDIEGSAESCLAWFQNPRARATSHYVVDAQGKVYQMVREHDIAWHSGNGDVNHHSIGIENNGYAYRPGFYNPAEYEGLAKLVRNISVRYSIPRDRQHIIGHSEVPNPNKPGEFGGSSGHTDPGPYWDWDSFMTMVKEDARLVSSDFPKVIHPGELIPVSVKYTNSGDDAWTSNNAGTEDPEIAAKGAVYLGTWAPFMHESAFFSYKYTTSPCMMSSATSGDAAPGAEAEFAFSLLGPRTYGTVAESYRVTRFPPAPKTPTAFGDVLSVSVEVKPWSLEFPAADAGFTGTGWTAAGKTVWRTAGTGAPFVWNPTVPISGNWDVYTRSHGGKDKVGKAVYTVAGVKEPVTVTLDQRKRKGTWVKLGRFAFDDPKTVSVSLNSNGKGRVVADSLKFEGPFEK